MSIDVRRRDADYEITVDGKHAGLAAVEMHEDVVTFTHTEVDDAYGGQGIGSQLARAALDDVRERGLKVRPLCAFVKAWIDKHPDYQDLLA